MKFKIGDKVKVIKNVDEHKKGDIRIIENFRPESSCYDYGFKDGGCIKEENIKLVKGNKKRIKKIEKELAELKLIIAKLREPSNLFKEELVKSNNELRAEVIEKAKNKIKNINAKIEYFINEEKRTVVCIIKEHLGGKRILSRGKAKCMPNDVFNEHIGKAIALGRALNLDVSEFEDCVQPDFAIGQKIKWNTDGTEYDILELNGGYCSKFYSYQLEKELKLSNRKLQDCSFIINDNNAIYEVK